MELAKRILKYRIIQDLDQNEMAYILGISNKTLCNIEQGKKVSLKTQIKVELQLDKLEKEN